jgi:chromosome segregation ATPase
MKIFNNEKPKNQSEEKLASDQYQKIISERKQEHANLKGILSGMHSEVASLMKEIKTKSEELQVIKLEKARVEKDIGVLNETYTELKRLFTEKQDTILLLDTTIFEIRKEIEEAYSKIVSPDSLKEECRELEKQVEDEKLKLFNLKSERKLLLNDTRNKDFFKPPLREKLFKPKKCSAKTATGKKCKKYALPGEEFCRLHLE